ncbi:hypothetical protein L6452_40785 [Arctium lappa]|uniref:Uncharacterized protein n=1 Tax=Arctium lappa TaxID=4217 RepID=A0ACB8XNR4_ARCLA|nr:hypothetical protein L6452_40785 [Arctium lappa]
MTVVAPYVHEHMTMLQETHKSRSGKWLAMEHNRTSAKWLKDKVKISEIRSNELHHQLRSDLVEHIWAIEGPGPTFFLRLCTDHSSVSPSPNPQIQLVIIGLFCVNLQSLLINRPQRQAHLLSGSPLSIAHSRLGSNTHRQIDSHSRLVLLLCFSVLSTITLCLSLSETQQGLKSTKDHIQSWHWLLCVDQTRSIKWLTSKDT